MDLRRDLPELAISVRQPWAWAIVHAGKRYENRSRPALKHMAFHRGPLAIHAAKGMTRDEYESARDYMASIGVACPAPHDLVRGGIIGVVVLKDIVHRVKDEDLGKTAWLFGPGALVLSQAKPVAPIAAVGALGLFAWEPSGKPLEEPAKWMLPGSSAIAAGPPVIEQMSLL